MVDQVAVVQFQSPAVGAATGSPVDITDPSITEAFHAGIFIVTGFDVDTEGADNTNGILGIGYCTINANGGAGDAAKNATICAAMLSAKTVTAAMQTCNLSQDCIRIGTRLNPIDLTGAFSAAIAGGVRLVFTTPHASGQFQIRVKGVAILFAGIADSFVGQFQVTTTATDIECESESGGNFRPNLLVVLTHDHPTGAIDEAEAQPNLGFAIDNAGVTNKLHAINIDEASTTDSDGYMRSDNCFGWLNLGTRVEERGFVGSFNANGFNAQSTLAGGIRMSVLALKFSGVVRLGAANMGIAASAGIQSFDAFGFTPNVVLGMNSLLTAEDTLTDNPGSFGYFVTGQGISRAHTARSQEGRVLPGSPTICTTRHEEVALLAYNDTGTIVQRATWAGGSDAGGFNLDFSTASAAGYMTALGIQVGVQETDTEQVSDQSALNVGQATQDTEETTDSVVLSGVGNTIAADTETLLDETGINVGEALSETETIDDTVTLMPLSTNRTQADPAGWTYG